MLIRYRGLVLNIARIAFGVMDEQKKTLTLYPSFDSTVKPYVINFKTNKSAESKARAIWKWLETNAADIVPPDEPKDPEVKK